MPKNPETDPFYLHKVALRPLLHAQNKAETKALFNELESINQKEFVAFLYRQGLAQLWLQFLLAQETLPAEIKASIKSLKLNAMHTAADQLMQQKVLQDVSNAFAEADIEYLVFKGAHLRHTIYGDSIHRPVCDIDILVKDGCKFEAVSALLKAGFKAYHAAENISHETSLGKSHVSIDLHWHLMRPGRTRINLSDYLFAHRQLFEVTEGLNFVGLDIEASLLVMLVHPAITKYVNGAGSSLRHLIDIHRLAQCNDNNWEELVDMLDRSGTRTAAWASLTWLLMLSDESLYQQFSDQLRPGRVKVRWLQFWLNKDLTRKLAERKLIIRSGFSLVLQDNLVDIFNAVRTLRDEKQKASQTMQALEQLNKKSNNELQQSSW